MQFKKTIATAALTASSVFALVGPGTESKTICLNAYTDADGVQYAGNCDESNNNKIKQLPLLPNGCAEKQTAVNATGYNGEFNVKVNNCLPPNVVQL